VRNLPLERGQDREDKDNAVQHDAHQNKTFSNKDYGFQAVQKILFSDAICIQNHKNVLQ